MESGEHNGQTDQRLHEEHSQDTADLNLNATQLGQRLHDDR